jgi:hypothetical protein
LEEDTESMAWACAPSVRPNAHEKPRIYAASKVSFLELLLP